MMKRMFKGLILVLVMMCLVTACSSEQSETAQKKEENTSTEDDSVVNENSDDNFENIARVSLDGEEKEYYLSWTKIYDDTNIAMAVFCTEDSQEEFRILLNQSLSEGNYVAEGTDTENVEGTDLLPTELFSTRVDFDGVSYSDSNTNYTYDITISELNQNGKHYVVNGTVRVKAVGESTYKDCTFEADYVMGDSHANTSDTHVQDPDDGDDDVTDVEHGDSPDIPTSSNEKICPRCDGTGECPICHGEGGSYRNRSLDDTSQVWDDCDFCDGGVCSKCDGQRVIR